MAIGYLLDREAYRQGCLVSSHIDMHLQEAMRLVEAGEAELKRLEHPDPYRVRTSVLTETGSLVFTDQRVNAFRFMFLYAYFRHGTLACRGCKYFLFLSLSGSKQWSVVCGIQEISLCLDASSSDSSYLQLAVILALT